MYIYMQVSYSILVRLGSYLVTNKWPLRCILKSNAFCNYRQISTGPWKSIYIYSPHHNSAIACVHLSIQGIVTNLYNTETIRKFLPIDASILNAQHWWHLASGPDEYCYHKEVLLEFGFIWWNLRHKCQVQFHLLIDANGWNWKQTTLTQNNVNLGNSVPLNETMRLYGRT
jgi:hypothetical protein